jgi:hypothetical protein
MAVVREIFDLLVCRKIHGCGCCRRSRRPEKYLFKCATGICHGPWLSGIHSGASRVLYTLWAMPPTLGFSCFARVGEFYCFFCRCQRVLPAGYDIDRESAGLRGRTGVLGWWGKYLTRSVRSVPLMAAEDLPSSRQFWVVCGGFISAGSGKHVFLVTQSHAQVSTPCDCIAKTANLPMEMAITISRGLI